jgi:Flp pilus assembly CpaE family ATPase
MFVCWSAKGGCGTTVVASSLALLLSHSRPTVLVDLGGDVPAALGLPEPSGPGVADWLASPTADAVALWRLAVDATPGLQIVPHGAPLLRAGGQVDPARWLELGRVLGRAADTVVVDAGLGLPHAALRVEGVHSLLVTRPCYLALRRAVMLHERPTGVVLVNEPSRSLTAADVGNTLGVPVVAEVAYDPQVFRCVDAGLLAARLPRGLAHPLSTSAQLVA